MWAFQISDIHQKIQHLRKNIEDVYSLTQPESVPDLPARDVLILEFKSHPAKKGFSSPEGQARMLHDLASIELQAMELGLRTLVEFPEASEEFKNELVSLTLSEADHLELCLNEIQTLGFNWGDWPANCGLWSSVSKEDTLIDRVMIVHRYLEGSGLDAGDTLLKRLAGVNAKNVQLAVKKINDEEVGHVLFGSKWFKLFCEKSGLNSEQYFESRLNQLRSVLPKRISPINNNLRSLSGFSQQEIKYLEKLRESFLESDSPYKKI